MKLPPVCSTNEDSLSKRKKQSSSQHKRKQINYELLQNHIVKLCLLFSNFRKRRMHYINSVGRFSVHQKNPPFPSPYFFSSANQIFSSFSFFAFLLLRKSNIFQENFSSYSFFAFLLLCRSNIFILFLLCSPLTIFSNNCFALFTSYDFVSLFVSWPQEHLQTPIPNKLPHSITRCSLLLYHQLLHSFLHGDYPAHH